MPQPICPQCDSMVIISGTPQLDQKVTCPRCGEPLEVVDLNPVELDYEYSDDDDDLEYEYVDDDDYEDYDDD